MDSLLKQCLELRDKKQCPNCYTEIEKNMNYCPNCGEKQEKEIEKEDDIEAEEAKEVEIVDTIVNDVKEEKNEDMANEDEE